MLPLAEDVGVVEDQVDVLGAAVANALALLLVELLEDDVRLEGLLGLHELLGELVEGLNELLLLVRLAHLPVLLRLVVEHGLVDVVDQGLEHSHRVLGDLTEEHLLVIGLLLVDRGAVLGVSHEEHALANELDVVTYIEEKTI